MNFFEGVGCATSNECLDFGDDPYHSEDQGIFKRNFYHCMNTS